MTPNGAADLRNELERLEQRERPYIATALAEARVHGDLKENAEYHAAKEKQAFIERRIREIHYKLTHATIIDTSEMEERDHVEFGAVVEIVKLGDSTRVEYRLVGEDEADVNAGKIYIGSPIAQALMGRVTGDIVEIDVPSGCVQYEIKNISYT